MGKILSPLRYPGSKRRLYKHISAYLTAFGIRPDLLVEPFAGGAGVALQLLGSNDVDKIALGDSDPWISAFWEILFFDTDWLLEKVKSVEVSLESWKYFKNGNHSNKRKQALACLFLNRTSYSGILANGAGPIGGWKQESKYKIDCRFNRKSLIKRIQRVAKYRDRVQFISCSDWRKTIIRARRYKKDSIIFYLDPPFFNKAHRLYRQFFKESDHLRLRDFLSNFNGHWLLSYDDAKSFRKLYDNSAFHYSDIRMLYSASTINGRASGSEVLVTNIVNENGFKRNKNMEPNPKKRSM